MKINQSRLLSGLLAGSLIFSSVPALVQAQDFSDAVTDERAADGSFEFVDGNISTECVLTNVGVQMPLMRYEFCGTGTMKLVHNCEGKPVFKSGCNITLDLNGYQLSYIEAPYTVFVEKGASVKVVNQAQPANVKVMEYDASKEVPKDAIYMDTFRLYNPNTGEHFYTKDCNERDHLGSVGWKDENAEWVSPSKSSEAVYRVYNPNTGDHHYTTDVKEKNALVALGWKDEDVAFYSNTERAVSIYRVYNPNAKIGSHHYTKDFEQAHVLVMQGWQYEGTCWYGM